MPADAAPRGRLTPRASGRLVLSVAVAALIMVAAALWTSGRASEPGLRFGTDGHGGNVATVARPADTPPAPGL